MTEKVVQFHGGMGHVAPLANIGVIENAIHRLQNRGLSDPGMIVISGPSGYGKSMAAAWAKARHRAVYLQLDDFVTKKSLLLGLCQVLNIKRSVRPGKKDEAGIADGPPRGTAAELADMVATELANSRRLLIIDEFDFAVDKHLVMSIFSIYEKSRASIILIGEEALPAKLQGWEKFSGRVLDTFYAEAIGMGDARTLARHKYPDFTFADDLLEMLVKKARGSARRMNNNLGMIHNEGMSMGWEGCDLATWGDRPLQESGVKRREKPIPGANDEEGA